MHFFFFKMLILFCFHFKNSNEWIGRCNTDFSEVSLLCDVVHLKFLSSAICITMYYHMCTPYVLPKNMHYHAYFLFFWINLMFFFFLQIRSCQIFLKVCVKIHRGKKAIFVQYAKKFFPLKVIEIVTCRSITFSGSSFLVRFATRCFLGKEI